MEYLSKPWTIITGFRDGGMASHGAAVGLLIGLWLFSRKNRLPYVWSLDRIMIAVGIGGAVVRMGNLFNSEIFGTATALPWGFEFVRSAKWVHEFAPAAVHPTQIYEALCYLATFGILCWLYYGRDMARRRPGVLFGIGLIGVFLTRFFIEFIKTVRTGMAARHGTVAEHSVHPAGSLYDLARNDAARRVRGRSGAEGGSGAGVRFGKFA